jgi:hypothetical protein
MTIGIGYNTERGVVLGSDMEMTGVAKFKGNKHYFKYFDSSQGVMAAVFSGVEDDMRCVWEELEEHVDTAPKEKPLDVLGARNALTQALGKVIKDENSRFQMLVGIGHPENEPAIFNKTEFFRVSGVRVVPANSWEIIGAGDCELNRYLTSVMDARYIGLYQALLWTAHAIRLSNSFVQGVGQGIQITIVRRDGKLHSLDGELFAPKMSELESSFAGLWADICDLEMPQEEFKQRLKNFSDAVVRNRELLPKVLPK